MSPKSKPAAADRRARSEQMKAEREAAARASERRTRLLVAVAVIAAVSLVGVAVALSRSPSTASAAVPTGVEAPAGGVTVGDDSAPVVLDEWVDFHCPACKVFVEEFGSTIAEQVEAGTLQMTYHPLSFVTPTGSKLAANAFGCAVDQGKTVEYHDAVFAAQGSEADEFTNEQLIEIGAGVGIDNEEFASCVNDGQYEGWVQSVAEAAVNQGVTRTPTLFLDGEEIDPLPQDAEALREAIEAAAGQE